MRKICFITPIVMAILILILSCGINREFSYLRDGKRTYPYTVYSSRDKSGNYLGIYYFMFPIFDKRQQVLKIEHPPGSISLKDIRGEEVLGDVGLIRRDSNVLKIDVVPAYFPLRILRNEKWKMVYYQSQFICEYTDISQDNISVVCQSPKFSLSYKLQRNVGLVEYDDFCGSSICKFRLVSDLGLFSNKQKELSGL